MVKIKFFVTWSKNDYDSVPVENTKENLFLLLKNIDPILKKSFKEYIARIDQHNFNWKVYSNAGNNSKNIF